MVQQSLKPIIFGLTPCPQASAFLARTTNLDARHKNAYIRLINGLVADGIWNAFDCLWILAAQDSTNSLLNLISTANNLTILGAPTFVADQGWTGLVTTSNRLSGPNVNTLTKYVQDSAHIMVWDFAVAAAGASSTVQGNASESIFTSFTGTKCIARINETTSAATASGGNVGFWLGTRTGTTAESIYKNGALIAAENVTSIAVASGAIQIPTNSTTFTISAVSYGSGAVDALQTQFYSRMHTYMQTIAGVA